MLMDCLEDNVGVNLSMQVPAVYRTSVFTSMTEIHVYYKSPSWFEHERYAEEVTASASNSKSMIHDLAGSLSIRNEGPLTLLHGDFGHNNIIFDDRYRLLGVIDWERLLRPRGR